MTAWGVTPDRKSRKDAQADRSNRSRSGSGAGATSKYGDKTGASAGSRPARPSGPKADRPYGKREENRDRFNSDTPRPTYPPRPARGGRGPTKTSNPHPARVDAKAGEGPQRIAKLLARAGVASRREVERMITDGRITRDGETIDTPATVLDNLRGVCVDGVSVQEAQSTRLFLFHKPSGYLTAERDPAGRPTIYDKLPSDLPRLMPIGRLDMNTEGLLLLTTDGEFKRAMELPSNGVERTYRARAFGEISQAQLEELIHGIEIEGVRYAGIDANLERRTGRNQWIEMTLTEGKNREVRRVLEHFELKVNRLIRTRYGPFELADLPPGAVSEISESDLNFFRKSMKDGKKGSEADKA
jgi:23S rRNA pseudouridine2605 synthase